MSTAGEIMGTPFWTDRRLSANDKAVFIVLAHLTRGATNDDPLAVRREAIAIAAGVSERSAQRSLTYLRRLGYIRAITGICPFSRRPALRFSRVLLRQHPQP